MVSYKEILSSNAHLLNSSDSTTTPHTSVFAGGTSGIGKLTIHALVSTLARVKIYILGRKSAEARTRAFIAELNTINPRAELVWVEAEISLLGEVKRVCEVIKGKESSLDLLFLTAGYAPFGGRKETAEGLELAQSLEYYSRMLFAIHLLPLLSQSERGDPRVISVLSGGLERASALNLDDLDLTTPGNFNGVTAHTQYGVMNTVALDKLAAQNRDVTFIHACPGWVSTGNARRSWDDPSTFMGGFFVPWVLEPLMKWVGYSDEEAGQRNLFLCTSAAFGGRGVPWKGNAGVNSTLGEQQGRVLLASFRSSCTLNKKVVDLLRETAQERVWEHTQDVLRPYL
ncbi:hypothetical protein FQN54_001535 [Arachnomyces sp. PD_36]|nr:hypothetical protein FQN54_001535 [Arachnomyces sp. PD_36]